MNADQKYILLFLLVGLAGVALFTAWRMERPVVKLCFAASKIYLAHSRQGGLDVREGWASQGDAFNQCVHRAETADADFRARYPQSRYDLTLVSTIGCHAPCEEGALR